MLTFVALYRGSGMERAQLVAVSTDPELVAHVAATLLTQAPRDGLDDPAADAVQAGRCRALRLIHAEATQAGSSGDAPQPSHPRAKRRPSPPGSGR